MRRFVILISVLTLILGALRLGFFDTKAQQTGTSTSDLTIGGVTFQFLTSVEYSGINSEIWQDEQNKTASSLPDTWKFGYEPLMIPITTNEGVLDLNYTVGILYSVQEC